MSQQEQFQQERFFVAPGGVRIHFLEFGGRGPKVVLLPGITSPAATWSFVGERLAERAHVYVLDARGRGLSDQRVGLGHSTADYAADAAGVMDELGLGPAIVLGHSMGARVTARLSATRPDLVERCILADPPVSGPGRRPYPSPLPRYLQGLEAASRGEVIETRHNLTPAQTAVRREWFPTCSPEAVTGSHRAFHEDDFFGDLPKIKCPALLLYARDADVIRESDADEIMAALPRGSRLRIDGVGHMMPFDDLELFLSLVEPFIHSPSPHTV